MPHWLNRITGNFSKTPSHITCAAGGGAGTDRAGVGSEGMGAYVGDGRGAVHKAGDPYDGGLGCHEDSRALDGAAGGGAVTDTAGVGRASICVQDFPKRLFQCLVTWVFCGSH